jgi:hypothetical protein
MRYSNFINKLSSDTKKALEESTNINAELRKHKFAFKKFNNNSIGYKIKYTFEIDNEIKNSNYLIALQIIINYILETEIFLNNQFFQYNFQIYKSNLRLNIFHSDKSYLLSLSDDFITNINKKIHDISQNIRNKFIEINSMPLKIKIKLLQKDYPILINILCNTIEDKKVIEKSHNITDCLIKLLFMNDINISRDNDIYFSTLKSQEDSIGFLTQFSNNNNEIINEPPTKKIKKDNTNQLELVNDNLKQLFWHSLGSLETEKTQTKKSYWLHSIIFVLILVLTIYQVPKYIQKLTNFSKNSNVIDNILDLATDDLTATGTATATKFGTSLNRNLTKLDTIKEFTEFDEDNNNSVEPAEPIEPASPSDDINVITRNIIKNFDNKNLDLKGIENRLKLILEETSTNN